MTLSVSIELVSLSARVKSVRFYKRRFVRETRHIDRTRRPGSDKNRELLHKAVLAPPAAAGLGRVAKAILQENNEQRKPVSVMGAIGEA